MINRASSALTIIGLLLHSQLTTASAAHDELHSLGSLFCNVFAATPANQLTDNISAAARDMLGEEIDTLAKPVEFRGRPVGHDVLISVANPEASLSVQLIAVPTRPPRTIITSHLTDKDSIPELQFVYSQDCTIEQAWQQFFDKDKNALYSQRLSPVDFTPDGERQWLNPPLPALSPVNPPRIRVGMIDSGVNYQLPEIANALARDRLGNLIGYDFWDMDALPFDAHPTQSPFVIQRHGTRTASIVIDEAPGIALVPYRYPRPDMSRMQALVEHAIEHEVRIIGMPLGGNRHQEWAAFQRAAENHPEILFIASAGNNGRDIDKRGVYPAALEIDNMLVVTSANDFVEPADRTNFGRLSVDYLLPAEGISALDYDGKRRDVSGSSYAVSRLVAMAARLLNRTPSLSTTEIMQAIEARSVRANSGRYVSTGYIGDLFADTAMISTKEIEVASDNSPDAEFQLPLDLFILSEKWDISLISAGLLQANDIFRQCGIKITTNHWYAVDAPDYLQNLATGNALTLRNKLPEYKLAVFFGDDTNMQPAFDAEAFGAGNTRNRAWMQNTLWITSEIQDLGIALAHELFHIMVNNGGHATEKNNLMQDRTSTSNTMLTTQQCEDAVTFAQRTALLK